MEVTEKNIKTAKEILSVLEKNKCTFKEVSSIFAYIERMLKNSSKVQIESVVEALDKLEKEYV